MRFDLPQRRGERDIELVIRQLRGGLSVGQLLRSARQRGQPMRPAQGSLIDGGRRITGGWPGCRLLLAQLRRWRLVRGPDAINSRYESDRKDAGGSFL